MNTVLMFIVVKVTGTLHGNSDVSAEWLEKSVLHCLAATIQQTNSALVCFGKMLGSYVKYVICTEGTKTCKILSWLITNQIKEEFKSFLLSISNDQ